MIKRIHTGGVGAFVSEQGGALWRRVARKAWPLLTIAAAAAVLTAVAPANAFGSGTITTFAGNGNGFFGFTGDGGPATSARLRGPTGVAVDAEGNVYIVDAYNRRVRKVNAAGTISTFAGTGGYAGGATGDGGPATSAQTPAPLALAVDKHGNLYIAECSYSNRVREIHDGIIKTIAGGGTTLGDGGPATAAGLWCPTSVAVDNEGNVFIADREHARVREVHEGIIKTVAGDGSGYFSGDGGPATSAGLGPESVAVDAKGNLFITEIDNARVREVHEGIIKTIAGTGTPGFSGDGGPATSAKLLEPDGIAVDQEDNVYVTTNNCRLRKISSGGTITTLAGTEYCGLSGDGCLASLAQLDGATGGGVWGLALDGQGDIYVAEPSASRVREIRPLAEPAPGCMTSPAEEAASKKRHEEEAAANKRQEEEAAATKKAEEEAVATKNAEEEAAAAAKKKAEEEAAANKKAAEEAAANKRQEEEAAAKKQQEEEVAANKKAAEEAAAKKKAEEETAAKKRQEEEEAAARKREEEEAAATDNISLDGLTIVVQRDHEALIKLTCAGTATCNGELTLTVQRTTGKGEHKHTKRQEIGTTTFSIPPGKSETVQLTLDGTGRALLSADHGHLSATLTILEASPSPSKTQPQGVRLVKAKGRE